MSQKPSESRILSVINATAKEVSWPIAANATWIMESHMGKQSFFAEADAPQGL